MLVAVLGGGAILAVALTLITIALIGTGNWRWTPAMSQAGKALWATGFALTVGIATVWIGPAFIIAAWPLWLAMVAGTALLFFLADTAYGFGPFSPRRKVESDTQSDTWTSLWRQHEGQPLPQWMLQAAQRGEVRYDGKVAQVMDGRLVAQDQPKAMGIEALFQRMDRLLGG